jgi:peptide/nickel transport system permease protein
MARFVAGRLLFAAFLIAASSSAALFLTRLAPGDLTSDLGTNATAAEVAAARERFDLNRSAVAQWGLWASRALRLDFGESFLYGRPVAPLVGRAAANTAALGLTTLIVATAIGLSLGIFTGSRRRGVAAALVRGASIACMSMPPLLTSLLLVFLAARTGWLPLGGMTSAGAVDQSWGAWIADVARHLPLPVLALALPIAATLERLQSQAMGDAMDQPFLTAATARGVPRRAVILEHAWPVSLRPICAVYGLVIGALLSGSFVVEFVTAWPGLGRLMYEALRARDIYLVAGCAAMGACVLAIGTLVGDLLLAAVDPRIREGGWGSWGG